MTKKEIESVFDWLEKNINKHGFYFFKLVDCNQITAYWLIDKKPFAQFYIKPILKIIEEENKGE